LINEVQKAGYPKQGDKPFFKSTVDSSGVMQIPGSVHPDNA